MIQFENVCKSYRNSRKEVVKNISFTIPTGKIVVLVGPSGCGKTTCLKMINQLIKITSGRILIDGKDVAGQDPIRLRRSLGYVIQQTGLFPHMTVRENIEVIPRLEKRDSLEIENRTIELMKMVELDPDEFLDRYPTQLSGGQMQRVGVARAFATDPDIILMDEPFSALDPITRAQLQRELIFIQSRLHKTIVFVTHDMDEAMKIGDMICVLKDGQIVQYDTPENIMRNPVNEYVSNFVGKNRIWDNPEYIYADDIMISDPLCVPHNLPLVLAIEQMRSERVTTAIVLDEEDRFEGFVFALQIQGAKDINRPVSSLVRKAEIIAKPKDSMPELIKKINRSSIKMIPVLDEKRHLKGLITNSSMVTILGQQFTGEEVQI